MPSLLPGFEYDIFISYRQNDNRSGWVRQFVEDLRAELAATIKEPVSIYYDENPHDGLHDTHLVDESLKGKLRCLIFIPILSRTYCDPKSFAWNHEFLPFCRLAKEDGLGPLIRLSNGNVSSRILPILIHDLEPGDKQLFEKESGSTLRTIEFVFRSAGVNRPLTVEDARQENQKKTIYRDQVNKAAIAIESIFQALEPGGQGIIADVPPPSQSTPAPPSTTGLDWFIKEVTRRNVFRAGLSYLIVSLLAIQVLAVLSPQIRFTEENIRTVGLVLAVGFPVAIILAWFYEISPHGFVRTTSDHAYANPYPPYRKKPLTSVPLLVVLIMAVFLMGVYIFILMGEKPERPQVTIGVLGFESRSELTSDRYIAEGLTEDIINRLIIIRGFRVTSDTKIKQAPEIPATAAIIDVARKLEASMLLMGSVERIGDSVVVRARLYDVANESYVWGRTFDRTAAGLVSVQSEIVQGIADRLDIDLNEIEELRVNSKATESATAYDFYLKGKNLYGKYNREANDSAIAMFKAAIEKDPGYARSWASLGDAFGQMYRFGYDYAWFDSSLAAGQRAIELDSLLSEGYKTMSNAYSGMRLYDKALPYLEKAVELNGRNASAVGNLGTNLFFQGRLPEALALQKESAKLNPKGFIPYQIAGWIYYRLGEYRKSEEWFQESLKLNPDFGQTYELLGYTYIAQGKIKQAKNLIPQLTRIKSQAYRNFERAALIAHYCGETREAKELYQKAIDENPKFDTDPSASSAIGLAQILLQEGQRVKAEVLLNHAVDLNLLEIDRGSQDDDPRYLIAAAYAIQGKTDESLSWLQKAIDKQWLDYDQIKHSPWFENLRRDSKYAQLLSVLKDRLEAMRKEAD